MADKYDLQAIQPFFYVFTALTLAANATGQQTLTLSTDSYFRVLEFGGSCTEDADTDFMPNNFSFNIKDQSTGRDFASALVPQRVGCGPSNGAILEKFPVRFAPGLTLIVTIANLTANSNTVTFVMKGYKEFIGVTV